MKKFIVLAFLATIGLMATDYSSYSAEELVAMRASVPAADREAFMSAMQSKLSQMTPEERMAIMSKAKASMGMTQTRTRTQQQGSPMDALGGGMSGGGHGAGASGGGGNGGGGGGGNH
jgi:uncharacterized membrane protein YgcG